MNKKNITFDFVGKRKIWYIISLIIIVAGMVSFAVQGLNFGIDFTGGSYLQLSFYENAPAEGEEATAEHVEVSLADLRAVVNEYVEQTPTIQYDETNTSYIIRTELTSEDQVNELLAAIESEIGAYQVDRNELVGPTIGAELVKKAILALIIACGLMLVYITVRFQFWFGVSSIIALLHDALIVLAIFSIFQLEVSSSFIAAILTVIGYSINATIVLFDRVRESKPNFKASEKKALINDSISNTLARSINTTITTLLTLLALIIFGGDTTKVFVFAMIVGIVAGFYSSVFISGSLYHDLSRFSKKNK
ncbi:MAG: protein translocase subunit SecF [Firmicutes bacterium]|nr:protein translocase subunit SecF [Bacillota bacterium]